MIGPKPTSITPVTLSGDRWRVTLASLEEELMQSQAPVQLTNVPPPPTCSPGNLFTGADCQDRINLYNQAKQQRQQQDIIKNLQEQMQADATVALRAKSAALSGREINSLSDPSIRAAISSACSITGIWVLCSLL